MALVLSVDVARWRDHVAAAWAAHGEVLPVVKGNGYGFGRARLVAEALAMGAAEVAVGTVHELAGIEVRRPVVLTPALASEVTPDLDATLTVGSLRHVAELVSAGWRGDVVVKLASSMRRYGVEPDELAGLLDAVVDAGFGVHGYALHPPLAANDGDHAAEVAAWLAHLPPTARLDVSHVGPAALDRLRAEHPGVRLRARLGTALWLGDKSFLSLAADVVDVRAVSAGDRAGYRGTTVLADGHVVMVTAGSAHGVQPLADGRSPFHFARHRLALVEPPHMHTSMVLVPAGEPCPQVGDQVDVQRPLTQTWVDRVEER